MTIDDAIALGRETLALEAAKTAAAQHDDAQHERLAEGFRQHCRTAAPTLAAALARLPRVRRRISPCWRMSS